MKSHFKLLLTEKNCLIFFFLFWFVFLVCFFGISFGLLNAREPVSTETIWKTFPLGLPSPALQPGLCVSAAEQLSVSLFFFLFFLFFLESET